MISGKKPSRKFALERTVVRFGGLHLPATTEVPGKEVLLESQTDRLIKKLNLREDIMENNRLDANRSDALAGCVSSAIHHKNAGMRFSVNGRLKEAISEFDEAIRLDSQSADAYLRRGNAYFDIGEFQRAIEDYDEAIRLDPQYAAAAYNNRGLAYYTELSEHQLAIEDFYEAARLASQSVVAYNFRGSAHSALGHQQRAIEDLDEAIRLDFQRAVAFAISGLFHTFLYRDSEAQQDMETALELGYDRVQLESDFEAARRMRGSARQ